MKRFIESYKIFCENNSVKSPLLNKYDLGGCYEFAYALYHILTDYAPKYYALICFSKGDDFEEYGDVKVEIQHCYIMIDGKLIDANGIVSKDKDLKEAQKYKRKNDISFEIREVDETKIILASELSFDSNIGNISEIYWNEDKFEDFNMNNFNEEVEKAKKDIISSGYLDYIKNELNI
jgi:hypothetical protein